MSRAFVTEQDGPELLPRVPPELPPGAQNVITPAGAAKFAAWRDALLDERRQLTSRDDGLARARLAEVEADLRYIEQRQASFVVTAPPSAPSRAVFGCEVVLEGPHGERVLRIVGVDEVDTDRGYISFASPIARAVLGRVPGDEVVVRTPRGDDHYALIAVRVPAA